MPTDETPSSAVAALEDGLPFPYLRWAKRWLGPDEHSLGLSGLAQLPGHVRAELGLPALPEIGAPSAELKSALAERYGLTPANVHPAAGTSHANFAVFFALARGRHVVVETPAYEALPCLGAAVCSAVSTVARDPARRWRLDRDSLTRALRPDTALIALSDLHNPSGVRLEPEDLAAVIEAAEERDAWVLVDEVYADFDPQDRPTAAHASPRVVVTNSLTKAHGLPDLRAGWVLGADDAIRTIEQWDDLVHPSLPPAPMAQAAAYIRRSRGLLERTRARAAERTDLVDAWVRATEGVRWIRPDGGVTGFLLFEADVDGDEVADRVWNEHGVRTVPGSFFQMRNGLRISYMLEQPQLDRALAAITTVLGSLR